MLGIKYPRPKFLTGSTLASLFRFSTTASELPSLRPRLQPQVDSARTPTEAGLRPQHQLLVRLVRTPTRAGLRL